MTFHAGKDSAIYRDPLAVLHEKYSVVLRQYFARRLKGRDESEDLTHDLLIKISSRLDFEKLDNPEGYLFSAAANLLRDRKRHEKIACKHFITDGPATEYTEGISPERILISKQSLRRIMAALNRLDRRARNVFILHRIEGMKYADIARMYGLSNSTIEKDMIRAIAHIARFAE